MHYIYDIILNFREKYYDFYEWQRNDKLINIKKIPIYKINTRDYLNIKNNEVTIERNTLPKQSKIFLITCGIEVMGLLIDNKGKVLKKSSLIFEESDDILEDRDEIKLINIKYYINKKREISYLSRINEEKLSYTRNYLNNLDKKQDEYILRYLYFDIYTIEEENIDDIYNKLIELSKNDIPKLYNSIKRVNIELKR